jgi:ribonucleoside-diphosphate reductase alpha chain
MSIAIFPDRRAASLAENARTILEARYLRRDDAGRVIETPEEMFRRVAHEVAKADIPYDGEEAAQRSEEGFFESMRKLEFLPNSPTLMNAGRDRQQLSACFVVPVEDSLDSIFDAVKHTALIHKSGGGTGFSFSHLRPKGERVRSTRGEASGPVSFMHVFDAATEAVRQGGARRGANMGILRIDHPDIMEFIAAKAGSNGLRNFNISVAVTGAFMDAVAKGLEYPLIHPVTGEAAGHLDAGTVFRSLCTMAWKCGDPGVLFLDAINRDNPTPWLGPLESTNPCGEQPLLPYESCNLGSVNLAKMVVQSRSGPTLDYRRLAQTVFMAVHFLDNVVDVNHYPLPEIESITRGNRKIGLGVMGWADALLDLEIAYGSEEAVALAGTVMGFIQRTAQRASAELARKRGPFPNQAHGEDAGAPRRNATVTTVAPAGTISLIAGCSSGIEPVFALSLTRSNILDGQELREIHPRLQQDLKTIGRWDQAAVEEISTSGSIQHLPGLPAGLKFRYRTAMEITPEWHVKMQAAFQKHCDNAVSKTVNLPSTATPADVERVYQLAHRLGCKGITVYRDRSRAEQVLNIGCVACM